MLDPTAVVALATGVGAIAATASLRWWRRRALRRRWQGRRVTRIADAGDGEVLIVGRARRREGELVAPVSARACIACQVDLYTSEDNLTPDARASQCVELVVEDPSGVALVRAVATPPGESLRLEVQARGGATRILLGGTTDPIPPNQAAFLKLYGHVASFWSVYTCLESVIHDDTTVAILGRATRVPDPNPHNVADYRELPTQLVITASATYPLLMTDDLSLIAPQ